MSVTNARPVSGASNIVDSLKKNNGTLPTLGKEGDKCIAWLLDTLADVVLENPEINYRQAHERVWARLRTTDHLVVPRGTAAWKQASRRLDKLVKDFYNPAKRSREGRRRPRAHVPGRVVKFA